MRDRLLYDGLHTDDWLGPRFQLGLPRASWRRLVVKGELVHLHDGDLPARVAVRVNGIAAGGAVIPRYGDFRVEVAAPPAGPGLDRVELAFEHRLEVETFHTPGQDRRAISARLGSIEID